MTTAAPPIARVETPTGPAWRATRYAVVKELLADRRLDMSQPDPQAPGWYLDSKVHRVMVRLATARKPHGLSEEEDRALRRRCMSRIFSVANVARVTPDIRDVAERLVNEMASQPRPVDLCESFSGPLCARTVGELLDVPADEVESFRTATSRDGDEDGTSLQAMMQVIQYVTEMVQQRRRRPSSDVVSVLLEVEAGTSKIHERRVVNLLAWMLTLGWQPPAACIDWGTVLLISDPEQERLFRSEPGLSTGAVEETLRLFNSQQATGGASVRYAQVDCDIDGVPVSAGDTLLLDIWSANRDPEVFPAPERFDVRRDPNPHLTFGYGFFMCNFARVARVEIEIGLTTLFRRLPGLRLAVAPDQLEYKDRERPAGVFQLPITW
jgi:cytochrome P450